MQTSLNFRSCPAASRPACKRQLAALAFRVAATPAGGISAPSTDVKDRLAAGPGGAVMTDATVPEGHKGLHGMLYGEGGAEKHESKGYSFRVVSTRSPWQLSVLSCAGCQCTGDARISMLHSG